MKGGKLLKQLLAILMMSTMLIGCTAGKGEVPETRGPVISEGSLDRVIPVQPGIMLTLSASTGCLGLHETFIATLTIKNNSDSPLVLKGDPPVDIEISVFLDVVTSLSDQQQTPSGTMELRPDEEIQYEVQWELQQLPSYDRSTGTVVVVMGYQDTEGKMHEPHKINTIRFGVGYHTNQGYCADLPTITPEL